MVMVRPVLLKSTDRIPFKIVVQFISDDACTSPVDNLLMPLPLGKVDGCIDTSEISNGTARKQNWYRRTIFLIVIRIVKNTHGGKLTLLMVKDGAAKQFHRPDLYGVCLVLYSVT